MVKKNSFLLISALLHIIAIYVVAQSVMFPSQPDSTSKKPDVIQATLIFDLPLPTPVILEVIEEEKLPVTETPPESQIKPISEPEVQVPPISPQALPPKVIKSYKNNQHKLKK